MDVDKVSSFKTTRGDVMGYNRGGNNRKARLKRSQKEMKRLAAKAAAPKPTGRSKSG
jgi:hypothetical protein